MSYADMTGSELKAEFARQAVIYSTAAAERQAILREMYAREAAAKAKTAWDTLTDAEKAAFRALAAQ